METKRKDWRTTWHIGYEANRDFYTLQTLNGPVENDLEGMWRCGDCGYLVSEGYLCPCKKLNKDDLRYKKDELDGKFIFGS